MSDGRTAALSTWISGRTPPVPARFAEWMAPAASPTAAGGDGATDVLEALADEAALALARALDPAERPRAGAFDLLAADGFLTWAAEAALESDDPDVRLAELVDRFSR